MVPTGGLEPPRVSPPPPQDGVSTNFTTSAITTHFRFSRVKSKVSTSIVTQVLLAYPVLFLQVEPVYHLNQPQVLLWG